ncbi:MAG: hypothetical protein MZV63_19530 [Marinilabiliales bacterium]|nr:hypothetical protein [Marinilabiliales bacterium]
MFIVNRHEAGERVGERRHRIQVHEESQHGIKLVPVRDVPQPQCDLHRDESERHSSHQAVSGSTPAHAVARAYRPRQRGRAQHGMSGS